MKISHNLLKRAALCFILLCGIFFCAITAAQSKPLGTFTKLDSTIGYYPLKKELTWGLLEGLESTVHDERSPHYGEDAYKFYAMYKYLTNKPILYAVLAGYGEDKNPDELTKQIHMAFLSQAIEDNFKTWIDQTRNYIYEHHREKDFKDILNILSKKRLELRQVGISKSDIYFKFDDKDGAFLKNFSNIPAFIHISNPFCFDPPKYREANSDLIHEIGHYWGLADRYAEGVSNSSIEHSTSGDVNSDAIMSSEGAKTKLTCDDIDGFINLIDYNLAKINGKYSKRADKGWKGFCDNRYYRQARQLNRPDHYRDFIIYSFNEDGTIASEKKFFNIPSVFNPFSVDEALTMDLNGTHKTVHPTDNYYILFDFSKLAENHYIEVRLGIADRLMYLLKAQRQGEAWNITSEELGEDFKQNTSVTISDGECHYTADSYGYSIKNYTAVFNSEKQEAEYEYFYNNDKGKPFHVISSTYGDNPVYRIYNQKYEVELTPSQFDSYVSDADDENDLIFRKSLIASLNFIASQQALNVKACRFFNRLKEEGF